MVGVGILRLPGIVAAAAQTPTLIILCWAVGGLYTLMGAVSVSELAAMYPEAGGFRVYARRAFGERAGFIVGWIDYLASVATLSYGAVSAIEFLGGLWGRAAQHESAAALALVCTFVAMHAAGLRVGGAMTSLASAAIGILLFVLIVACFLVDPTGQPVRTGALHGPPEQVLALGTLGTLLSLAPAMRALLTAYDGWYAPIYTAEESVDAPRILPRAIIGGGLLVMGFYLALNIALLRVMPVGSLSASRLPVADAAQLVLPHGSAVLMTALSILIMLSLINTNVIIAPRILFSIAREGWIPEEVSAVSAGGTPYVSLGISALISSAMILTGTFNELIALFAVLILLYYIAAFLAVFVLRFRAPEMLRPYKALGYPFSTLIVLFGSVAILMASVAEDWRSAGTALAFIALCIPAYALASRSRRVRRPEGAAIP